MLTPKKKTFAVVGGFMLIALIVFLVWYSMQQPVKTPSTGVSTEAMVMSEARKAAEAAARKAAEAEARKPKTVSKDLTWLSAWDGPSGDTGCKDGKLDSKAWCAAKGGGTWIQLDTGVSTSKIHGIVTQGRSGGQWVTHYHVKVSNDDKKNWDEVDEVKQKSGSKEWIGNTDTNTKVTNIFPTPVVGRYVRVYPTKWDYWPSMRMGVILSQGGLDTVGLYDDTGTSLDLMQQTGLTVSPV